MRNAPSVRYPVGRCFFYAGLLVALGVLGMLAGFGLGASSGRPLNPVADGLGAALWLVWAVFAGRSWWHAPVGHLQWDAQAAPEPGLTRAGVWRWHRQAPNHPDSHLDGHGDSQGAPLRQVQRVLDLQSLLLLRVRNPDGAHRWLWVERRSDPARWNDLRRALVQAS